jgi:hypothetical protein
VSAIACPTCGRINTDHDRAPGQEPRDGDVGLCWGCGNLAIFVKVDGSLAQRLPTDAEQADIEQDPEFQRARAAIAAAASPQQALGVLWGSS